MSFPNSKLTTKAMCFSIIVYVGFGSGEIQGCMLRIRVFLAKIIQPQFGSLVNRIEPQA
jgi:hypothetical protein